MDPDSTANLIGLILIPVLLLLLQFFFTLGATAITQLPDSQLKKDAQENRNWGKIQNLVSRPNKFLLGSEIFEALVTLFFGLSLLRLPPVASLTNWIHTQMGAAGLLLVLLAVCLATVLIVFPLARVLPRRLAQRNTQRLALSLFPFVWMCIWLVYPITSAISLLGYALLRLSGIDPGHQPEQVTEEEIRMMVDAGEETGVIQQSEKDMINNIFEFDDRSVDEVMTHRMDLVAVEADSKLDDILAAAQEGYSRIPVYREDIDNIIGVLYVKDLLPLITGGRGGYSTEKLMRKPLFVPESTRCSELFTAFTTQKVQFAVIIDEYGGTSGIVTMEDLLESIVGNIQDEYDQEEDQSSQISEKAYTLDGSMTLDEVEHLLDIALPEDAEYDTIGGLMVGILDYIPSEDQHPTVEISGVKFTSTTSDDRRIIKIVAEVQ